MAGAGVALGVAAGDGSSLGVAGVGGSHGTGLETNDTRLVFDWDDSDTEFFDPPPTHYNHDREMIWFFFFFFLEGGGDYYIRRIHPYVQKFLRDFMKKVGDDG